MNAGDNLEVEAIDFTREGVIASVTNMDSMNHAPNNLVMVMDNSIGEHITDSMGGNLVSVPITFMDKDNVGIIDSLYNETLAAREPVNESRGSSRESKGKQASNTRTWKRKERAMKQKTKKQGTCGESGKEAEGKKRRGLIEGMDGNNGERKKIKGLPESQCTTVEADIQPCQAQ